MPIANIKLNHVNLPVTDVIASAKFFEQYFNFKCTDIKGNNMLAVMEGEDGFILVLMADTFNRNGNNSYPDAFHIGFLVESHEQVAEVFERLKEGGIDMSHPPGALRGGYGFYFNAPGNILTEVTCLA
ncbi:Catechol 2,3-dioxygenase [Mucilaginibacter gossypiicola]|uniref:Catechol 2,3-dioxygenase n=1 Tax=Mucilaginibacter gossypiicola TaxID=551995 RepID=A0A1H8HHU3_9SPHI|nr:VOC family protein [Mucilaginibacter gossypiicola]SEN55792.1 Catechol 2,3-dioxygenase [Mucilaginibacter gossypiicola]